MDFRPVANPCCVGFQSSLTPFSLERGLPLLAACCRFLASILHSFLPANDYGPVTDRNDGLGRDDVQVEHLVAGRAENDEVTDFVVAPFAIEVAYFQDFGYAKATVGAVKPFAVVCESELAIIDPFHGELRGGLRSGGLPL